MRNTKMLKAVGVSFHRQGTVLYFKQQTANDEKLLVAKGKEGKIFSLPNNTLTLRPGIRQKIATGVFYDIRLSLLGNKEPAVTFLKKNKQGTNLYIGSVKKFDYWSKIRPIKNIKEAAVIFEGEKKQKFMFFGNDRIYLAVAGSRESWKPMPKPLLEPRHNFFDNSGLTVGQVRQTEQGILLTYYARYADSQHNVVTVGAAMFDSQNPGQLIWRSDYPLWQQPKGYRHLLIEPIGEVDYQNKSLLYLQTQQGEIFSVDLPLWQFLNSVKKSRGRPHLQRSHKNPILMPRSKNSWESKATFNPAAFFAKGRIHLIYRAIGDDDISTFGYASSLDGLNFDERLDYPIYAPRASFEGQSIKRPQTPSAYASGGSGIGGCEDPRVSVIDETLYMTYVAFDGWNPPRVALTSILLEDFLNHRWNWKEPVLITPYLPGEGNKNSCILPEKIDGKYAIFHRIWPDILIDYADDLNFDGKNKFLSKTGHAKIKPRKLHWDSRKIGIGATPIKTSSGWLLIYQAVGNQDGSKYKIGAMLLDLQNPAKVLARAQVPVLEPEAWYENEGWKYGVVYPCGAVVKDDELYVYYGGADTYSCVAKANLPDFLSHLLTHQPAVLESVVI